MTFCGDKFTAINFDCAIVNRYSAPISVGNTTLIFTAVNGHGRGSIIICCSIFRACVGYPNSNVRATINFTVIKSNLSVVNRVEISAIYFNVIEFCDTAELNRDIITIKLCSVQSNIGAFVRVDGSRINLAIKVYIRTKRAYNTAVNYNGSLLNVDGEFVGNNTVRGKLSTTEVDFYICTISNEFKAVISIKNKAFVNVNFAACCKDFLKSSNFANEVVAVYFGFSKSSKN